MRPAYKQHVREFVKGGRAALVNHSLDEGLRLKDTRNRPLGDPNCELFPQGTIIPVPPSTPPWRQVGICGNNWAVSPGNHAKRKPSNQRVRGLLFPLFRWWLCSAATPKQHQSVLSGTKTRIQKPVSAIPTRYRNLIPWLSGMIQGVLWYLQFLLVYYACTFRNVKATSIVTQLVIFSSKPRSVLSRKSVFSVGNAIRYITGRRFELLMQEDHINVCPTI